MDALNGPPRITIKQWEKAGIYLLAAFNHYVDMCTHLEADSDYKATEPQGLEFKIQNMLEAVHTTISDQLPKTTATLARTRNKLMSPVLRLPEEVLSDVFAYAISDSHGSGISKPRALTMKPNVQYMYSQLHIMRQVCSAWRDVITTRGALWSVIPMVMDWSGKLVGAYQPSLERVRGCPLHLAVVIGSINDPEVLYQVLRIYGPRFHTINLLMDKPSKLIKGAVEALSQQDISKSLSELSIAQYNSTAHDDENGPPEPLFPALPMSSRSQHQISSQDSSEQAQFAKLLKPLAVFRASGVYIQWNTISFSSRLVELYISNVELGHDDEITPFLNALSSAVELRDLKLINISTYRRTADPIALNLPTVVLPKLQSLLLQDMYLNTLEPLLSAICSGSCRLTLIIGPESFKIRQNAPLIYSGLRVNSSEDGDDFSEAIWKWTALGPIQVDTLIMRPIRRGMWPAFYALLTVMPNLKTLKLDSWIEWKKAPSARATGQNPFQSNQGRLFSALEGFHLTRVNYGEIDIVKQMVTSFAPREIVIGGDYTTATRGPRDSASRIGRDLLKWLKMNASEVHPVEATYCPPELYLACWQLW